MAHVEASIGLPLLAGALWDRRKVWQPRTRLKFHWTGDEVKIRAKSEPPAQRAAPTRTR